MSSILVSRPLAPAPCPIPLLRASTVPHPERAARRGELVPVIRGIYAPAELWRRLPAWDRYLARVHAAAKRQPDLVFSHESAAALLGMPVLGDPGTVHGIGGTVKTSARRTEIRMHTAEVAREVVDLGGITVTAPAECAVDLARGRSEIVGLIAADAALRLDPAETVETLVARNEQRRSSRGRRIARWALHRASADSESTLESVSRGVIDLLGYAEPALQVKWFDGIRSDRADFWWTGDRVIGEADGDLKYDGRFGDAPALLRARRERDARLRAQGVRSVLHWGWSDVADPDSLDGLLRGAGLRRLTPPDHFRLAGVRSALAARGKTARLHPAAETEA